METSLDRGYAMLPITDPQLKSQWESDARARALEQMHKGCQFLLAEAEVGAQRFVRLCRQERTELRAQIGRAEFGRYKSSKFVLLFRYHNDSIDLYWAEMIYPITGRKVLPKRVNNGRTGPHITRILRGAHPDEIDTLRRHEMGARRIRGNWKEACSLNRRINSLMKQRVAELAADLASP